MSVKKKVFVKTYGCQMNVYDSQRMGEALVSDGYELTEKPDSADLILLNTCHIREKAAEKIYSELGRYKKLKAKKPSLKIGVTGCVAQAEGKEIIKRQPLVDLVVGPQAYHRLPKMLQNLSEGKRSIDIEFPTEDKFLHLPKMHVTKLPPAAFLTVQEGCDKFCAFCVVPYTRGAEVSRSPKHLIAEAQGLVEKGVVEITLLGQNVNGYLFENVGDGWDLARLISELAKIPDLKRIRFTTSHPNDMSDSLINIFGNEEKLMPYLHLPVQSGSDKILKAMNRRHSVDKYLNILSRVRKARPDIALSGDFIVGFPGETDSDFQDTLDLCNEVGYAQAYSFKYSSRPGTPAAGLEEIEEEKKSERLLSLQSLLTLHQKNFQKRMIGNEYPVLIEKKGKEIDQVVGRSPYLQPVFIKGSIDLLGEIVPVEMKSYRTNSLEGEIT
jgi:tRNA-2-methylthio-N6-dimethylallyladenosine synthase